MSYLGCLSSRCCIPEKKGPQGFPEYAREVIPGQRLFPEPDAQRVAVDDPSRQTPADDWRNDKMATNATVPALEFDPADERGWILIVLVCTLVPFATFVVGLRFYARAYLSKGLGWDDWAAGWSMVRSA
jgi:hypothetical protein